MNFRKNKPIVFVGLSGGVDSAVSAMLLKQRDYEVVGIFIKTWHPDFLECNEEQERIDSMRVAAYLDIPFLTFDFENVYKKEVADYMIREYKMGRTPNPDVMCNKEVKFGAFLKKALAMGADFVATGHYARLGRASRKLQVLKVHKDKKLYKLDEPYELLTARDSAKDQSYFLWTLKQEQLKKILFPIGDLKKSEVRILAKKFNLPVAEKKDSQGICFLGAVDLKEFLKHYIKEKNGKVVNEQGEEIGYHNGAVFYTLGERHGFTIIKKMSTDGAYYVISKNMKKNILVVSQNKNIYHSIILTNFRIKDINWISKIPKENKNYTAQIRYHGELLLCRVVCQRPSLTILSKTVFDIRTAEIIFEKPVLVASGQSCVIYDNDVCLGGGVVV